MSKVIAVYDKDKFIGYVESSARNKTQGISLVTNIWDSKTYLNETTANKAIDAFKSRGFEYSFDIKDFEL